MGRKRRKVMAVKTISEAKALQDVVDELRKPLNHDATAAHMFNKLCAIAALILEFKLKTSGDH